MNNTAYNNDRVTKTWWAAEWLRIVRTYIEQDNRDIRGLRYYKSGKVEDINIEKQKIRALVNGKYGKYDVIITFKSITKSKLDHILKCIEGEISYIEDLYSGTFPIELKDLLADTQKGVYPSKRDLEVFCTCKDYQKHHHFCKHIISVLFEISSRLDNDTKLFFSLRGIELNEIRVKHNKIENDHIWSKTKIQSNRVVSNINCIDFFDSDINFEPKIDIRESKNNDLETKREFEQLLVRSEESQHLYCDKIKSETEVHAIDSTKEINNEISLAGSLDLYEEVVKNNSDEQYIGYDQSNEADFDVEKADGETDSSEITMQLNFEGSIGLNEDASCNNLIASNVLREKTNACDSEVESKYIDNDNVNEFDNRKNNVYIESNNIAPEVESNEQGLGQHIDFCGIQKFICDENSKGSIAIHKNQTKSEERENRPELILQIETNLASIDNKDFTGIAKNVNSFDAKMKVSPTSDAVFEDSQKNEAIMDLEAFQNLQHMTTIVEKKVKPNTVDSIIRELIFVINLLIKVVITTILWIITVFLWMVAISYLISFEISNMNELLVNILIPFSLATMLCPLITSATKKKTMFSFYNLHRKKFITICLLLFIYLCISFS